MNEGLVPLARQDRWVIWRWEGKKKVPYQARYPQRRASSRNPETWSSYDEAVEAERRDGIGFVIGGGIGAFDLDDCRSKWGELDDWAAELMLKADTYTEVTPSRTGLRIIGRAYGGRVHTVLKMPTGKLEVYRGDQCGRYIAITHQRCYGRALRHIDDLIDAHVGDAVAITGPVVDVTGQQSCELWLASLSSLDPHLIIAKYKVDPWLLETAVPGKRSDVIWKLALTLRGAGASKDEVGACVYSSLAWQRKHGPLSARALASEVRRAFSKK